jgi:hypothetical protein
MAADNDHARFLESLGEAHEKRIIDSLSSLEDKLAGVISKAPLKQGALFDLEWAVAARKDISAAIQSEYLTESSRIIDEYTKAATSAGAMLNNYGDFVGLSDDVIRALKAQSFQGFQNIAGTFLNEIATEVYQNTISGRSAVDSVNAIRQKINGVYAQSDQVEVQRLVNIANAGGAAAEDAVKQLHSIYASDRLGNNMRRYSSQMVHDSLMQFDASVVTKTGFDSGADAWKYYGSNINDTRQFCRDRSGNVYTEEQIRELWTQGWAGKSAGDPFIVRGGYNCRHHWRPVFTELEDAPTVVEDTTQGKPLYQIPVNLQSSNQIDDFAASMSALSDDQIRLVNKLPPIEEYAIESDRGYYQPFTRKLVAQPLKNNGATVRHEYGHHVDFEIGRKVGNAGVLGVSATDKAFVAAYELDRKGLNLHKTAMFDESIKSIQAEIYDFEEVQSKFGTRQKKVLKDVELGNYSDIVDALSHGKMQKMFGGHGHGVSYFKMKESRQQEAFANLFALKNTKYWGLVQQRMPNMAKRFDEITKEYLDEGS